MESHTIHKLAEKYWQGECTDQEERELAHFLSKNPVPAELEELAEYLHFLKAERQQLSLNDDFDTALLQQLQPKPQPRRQNNLQFFLSIAAAVVILMVSSLTVFNLMQTPIQTAETEWPDTFDNSEEAYREVRKALLIVSSTMNDGLDQTEMLSEFHKANDQIRK